MVLNIPIYCIFQVKNKQNDCDISILSNRSCLSDMKLNKLLVLFEIF